MIETIYLDHAATTPMHPEVIEEMQDAMKNFYGNASSVHQLGKKSRGVLEEARIVFAKSIQAKPSEIVMTSGGTESDNTAIIKSAEKLEHLGKHIIATTIEHPAVREPLRYLEDKGFEVTYLPVNEEGKITLKQVKEAVKEETILVSIIYGNNEIGSLMPIKEVGEWLNQLGRKIYFHTDAVQAYGSEPINVKEEYIDLLSVSSHKINGPKGIGFLYINEAISIPNLLLGGEQENKYRAGTESVPSILGFKKAVEIRMNEKDETREHYNQLKQDTVMYLKESKVDFFINGTLEGSLPHILSIHFPGVAADKLLIHLDLSHIAVSIGSACTAGNVDPSHVLMALHGKDHPAVSETVRISFGLGNTKEEIKEVVTKIEKAVDFLSQN